MIGSQPSLLTNVTALSRPVDGVCAHCGQRLARTFAHHLTKGLVSALWKLYQAGGGPIRLGEIGLTNSEFANAQKLIYFGLSVRVGRGKWQLNRDGADFLRGQLSAPRTVFTRAGRVVDREGLVLITDVIPGWQWAEDYAREAKIA